MTLVIDVVGRVCPGAETNPAVIDFRFGEFHVGGGAERFCSEGGLVGDGQHAVVDKGEFDRERFGKEDVREHAARVPGVPSVRAGCRQAYPVSGGWFILWCTVLVIY